MDISGLKKRSVWNAEKISRYLYERFNVIQFFANGVVVQIRNSYMIWIFYASSKKPMDPIISNFEFNWVTAKKLSFQSDKQLVR